jgi:predicted pyridoxine 5'-phosphate oxidase superfamily flavin-nucleotide-binding protein
VKLLVNVSDDVRENFIKQRTIPMATSSKDGVPNVIYVGMWWWEDDETLCVVNNYLNKTLRNIHDNPRVSFISWIREEGKSISYQIKCNATEQLEGDLFEKMRKVATERERPYPGHSVIVCKVNSVYQGSGGKGAGDKLA